MTRVADSGLIGKAKEELLTKIKTALDLKEIKKILEDHHNLEITDDLEVQSGEIIIHNNRIGYRMEFEVLLSLSVLLDEDGNYIPEETPEENIDQLGSQAEDIIQEM
ncbi:MAG: hypothetical protein BWK80_13265 [Desulfobacteraceae bacterium IS3]|nr:MAG: hypothetical protein BWK80_13265 [Desulfobacteraceae bacterium IS3]